MKLFLTAIICLVTLNKLHAQCADESNVFTFTYDGKEYEVVKEQKTWENAAACAVERGGHLVEINDTDEQNAVYTAIVQGAAVSPTYASVANGGGIAYVWIGATDKNEEGTWIWDGTDDGVGDLFWSGQGDFGQGGGFAINDAFYNWGGTSTGVALEPDNFGAGQDYAGIALTGWPSGTTLLGIAGEWNDIIGTSQLYFVIEKENTAGMNDGNSNLNEIFQVYPNPTTGILNFDKNYESIEIYDFSGKLLKQFKNAKSIHVGDLEKGTYLFHVMESGMFHQGKFSLN